MASVIEGEINDTAVGNERAEVCEDKKPLTFCQRKCDTTEKCQTRRCSRKCALYCDLCDDDTTTNTTKCEVSKCNIKNGLELLTDTVEPEVAMLRNELETLKQFVETHDSEAEAKLDQLTSKDNELQAALDRLAASVKSVQNELAPLTSKNNQLQNGLNSVQNGLNQVVGRMGSAEGKLATLPGEEFSA